MILLTIAILLFSVVLHEVSHGLMADRLGDPTPRMQGRLTLNPISHLDPIGSIVVPLITSIFGFTFGWAKPVEYNPYNLVNKRRGEFLIALAGPVSNLIIAVIFGLIIRFTYASAGVITPFISIASYIVLINIVLAVFNLIPLPPLDGSKLLFSFLPQQYGNLRMKLEAYGPIFVMLVIFFLWQIVAPLISPVYFFLTGINMI